MIKARKTLGEIKVKYLKFLLSAALVFGGLIFFAPQVKAACTVNSDVISDTTWSGEVELCSKTINVSSGVTLTIEAGTVVKMNTNTILRVEGTLNANGTAESEIIITSSKAEGSRAPGDWKRIIFFNGTGNFTYTTIEYAGGGFVPSLYAAGSSSISLDNTTIRYGKAEGFFQTSDTGSTITNSNFNNNGTESTSFESALLVEDGTANISDTNFDNNRAALQCGVLDDGSGSINNRPEINLTNVSFTNVEDNKAILLYYTCNITASNVTWPNGANFFAEHIGNINGDMTLPSFGMPILLTPHIGAGDIDTTISGSLTVPAGTTFKVMSGKGVTVEGKLIANGTQDNPVVFTSDKTTPAAGDWTRIRFLNTTSLSSLSELNYTTIQYGGSGNTGQLLAGKNSNVSATRLKFESSAGDQCSLIGSTAQFTVTDSDFSTCDVDFVFDADGAENTVMAENNWWGSDTGPFHATDNPDGEGVAVTGNIDFDPWLGQVPADDEEDEEEDSGEVLGDSTSARPSAAPVYPPVFASLTASTHYIHKGEPVTLTWSTANANFIVIHGLLEPVSNMSGKVMVVPDGPTKYVLEARNERNEAYAEVFVHVEPYDRDPVIVIPGIMGSGTNARNQLVLDPYNRLYDDLVNTLRLNGYEDGITLFTFPYQWRWSNEITWRLLMNKIEDIRAQCICTKVDIVAHSMGGLVARAYVQSDSYKNDIDEVIFLGTPHIGAPKAYLMWEGGEFDKQDIVDLGLQQLFNFEAKLNQYKSTAKYVRETVLSVQDLLPIYNYLRHENTGQTLNYYPCQRYYPCNPFLEKLEITKYLLDERVDFTNIVTNDLNNTLTTIGIDFLEDRANWPHGKAVNKIYDIGDSTVPVISANHLGSNIITSSVKHTALPSEMRGDATALLLDVDENSVVLSKPLNPVKKFLMFFIHSPVHMDVIMPDGTVVGFSSEDLPDNVYYTGPLEEGEYLIISNPMDGEYTVKAYAFRDGDYEIEMSLITDTGIDKKSVTGTVKQGDVNEIGLSLAEDLLTAELIEPEPPLEEESLPEEEPDTQEAEVNTNTGDEVATTTTEVLDEQEDKGDKLVLTAHDASVASADADGTDQKEVDFKTFAISAFIILLLILMGWGLSRRHKT